MPKNVVEMEIDQVTMELPDTKTLRLRWPEEYKVDFKTGQFITLYWPDSPRYKRAYSLSSCALDEGFFEVTINVTEKWARVSSTGLQRGTNFL